MIPPSPPASRILPVTKDHDSAGFWQAARCGELAIRVCRAASHVLHLPHAYCSSCDSYDTEWIPVSGRARVHTWTIVEHAIDPAFPVPYTIVLLELAEPVGVRFVTNLAGRVELSPGDPMVVRFEPLSDGVVLPRWELEKTVDSSDSS